MSIVSSLCFHIYLASHIKKASALLGDICLGGGIIEALKIAHYESELKVNVKSRDYIERPYGLDIYLKNPPAANSATTIASAMSVMPKLSTA